MLWLRYQSGHKLEERQIEVLSKDNQTEAKASLWTSRQYAHS